MEYFYLIQGGTGPDVWDKEGTLSAVDITDAAKQAKGKAEELGGECMHVSRYKNL